MQYTPHYNLNLPDGTDIVNPLVQDNPNYSAIDTALYNNKLRVVGTATHVKTGTNHAITLGDSDINQFKFVATGDYSTGDTFTVDGVTVTPRIADGSTIPNEAFKINSTVLCILDGTVLNLINVDRAIPQDLIDDVAELKASQNWKSLGTKSGTIGGSDFYLQIPSEAKEAVVYVAWTNDLSYVYDFTIADFPNYSRYFGRSFSTSQGVTIVLTRDKKVTVNDLEYNNVAQTTALFTVLWR